MLRQGALACPGITTRFLLMKGGARKIKGVGGQMTRTDTPARGSRRASWVLEARYTLEEHRNPGIQS